MDENNILESIRKMIGSDDYFDPDILIAINAAFSTLTQLGVGPVEGTIVTANTNWTDFVTDTMVLNLVKQYTALKVKLYFDVSTASSYLIDTMQKQCDELEWRLNVAVDPKDTF